MEVPSIGTVVIVGFGMVFCVLAVLVIILSIQGRILGSTQKKAAEIAHNATVVPAPVNKAAALAAAPVAPVIESGIPPEVVAAIAAAVAAMDGGKYTLRSLTRKKDGRNPWSVAATISYTQPF